MTEASDRHDAADYKRVVCLGASIVQGEFSVNFVDLLQHRLGQEGFRFINAGINGNLSYDVLRRLDSVLEDQPDFVVILVGTNDVMATLNPLIERLARRSKKLPRSPSPQWYRENMQEMVRRLKAQSAARIAVCSLPILGENLASQANLQVQAHNSILADIARQEQVAYLPVYERQTEYLRHNQPGGGRTLEGSMLLPMTMKFLLLRNVLRFSLDRISQINGFLLTIEGIHMNSTGAAMIAAQIEPFLRG